MNTITNATNLLASIVRENGTEVYSVCGYTIDDQGLFQETYNIAVSVKSIEAETDTLYFIETNDSGDMREFEQLEIEDVQDLEEAVKAYLSTWDSEWTKVFAAENII